MNVTPDVTCNDGVFTANYNTGTYISGTFKY